MSSAQIKKDTKAIPEPEGNTEIIETDFDIGQDNCSGALKLDLDIHKIVFSVSAIGIMPFAFLTLAFQNDAEPLFVGLRDWLTGNLDWFFLLSGNIVVIVCLGLFWSPLGKVRLGGPDATPDYRHRKFDADPADAADHPHNAGRHRIDPSRP